MILIKDRHLECPMSDGLSDTPWENMILIKDRHFRYRQRNHSLRHNGKYDTYKGSTLKIFHKALSNLICGIYVTYKGLTRDSFLCCIIWSISMGNMILIKNRHPLELRVFILRPCQGKYDTYKGSTLSMISMNNHIWGSGNMILIKD